ncbi:restin homolog isoform X3 [Lucilia sericata]|uniref:restin homolog isoform X3 n=1 Tax=Lucilia sericata TaxID=13632 RepID=UPI0018A80EA6|nr:restin homolog isoform X3 [Lucilia sericata]
MSETNDKNNDAASAAVESSLLPPPATPTSTQPPPASNSSATTPASSVTGVPPSRLKAPTNFGGSSSSVSKIGRPCSHATPKAGPPPRDTNSMSRESDDNLSSINSQYTDLYQETVKRFTRSSLSPEMDRFSPSRYSFKSSSPFANSDSSRRQSYHGSILTHDTEQFIIGQRVWVGGIRPGQIAYIGETHFAPGEWAGVVLDEPSGKNDGCVAGKRYFQCEPKKGIFSRLTRLTLAPLPGAQTPTSPLSKFSPDRSRTVSPTASIRSSFLRSPGKNGLTVGDRVIVSSGFGSRPGILRYLGETQFASGNWCGIELDEASGKNDGSVDGVRYFECKPKFGVFVPIAKVSLSPSSKKSRLSRTGSRESLTSIGTMNSIATTNTSRLRLNAQQRKSSSFKPVAVTTPKSQFSMQDLLREKQQHIEQLMIERDLDREDSQNTALQFQKNINELKTYIALLERQLSEERKKAEDLQFSIDEATFCGDELNAQTQVYKEKIHELETKIKDLTSGKITSEEISATASAEVDELKAKLSEQAQQFESQIAENQDELQRLQENIKYLKDQNEALQKELVAKDESLEKFSLSECGLENMRKELTFVKEEHEKERQQVQADFNTRLEEKSEEIKRLLEENATMKKSLATIETERTSLEDECRILREECKTRSSHVEDINNQLAKISAELAIKHAECVTLDEMVKAQQLGKAEEQTQLEEKIQEISKLKEEVVKLQETKNTLETNLKKAQEELLKLAELQSSFETKLQEALSQDQDKNASMLVLEQSLKELRLDCEKVQNENKQLNVNIKSLQSELENEKVSRETVTKTLSEKEISLTECNKNLEIAQETINKLKKELEETFKSHQQIINDKTNEIQSLKEELGKLQDKTAALEGESSITVQQLSAKINQLESQNKRLEEDLKNSTNTIEDQRQKSIQQDEVIASKMSELKSTTTALETTSKLLEKLKGEHETSLTKKQELEDEIKKIEEKNAQQQLDLGDLARKLESSNAKCDNLISQNEALQQEIIAARASSSTIHNEVKKLNEEIQSKQNEISNLVSNHDKERIEMTGQLEELQQKLANNIKDFNDVKEVVQKSKEEISQKVQQITELEEKTIKQELQLSDNQRQRENLQTKYDALVKQNESLQQDLNTLRTSSTDSNAELIKLSQEIANKQKAFEELLDKSSGERATLESQLQASQQRIDGMCSQVETLTNELKNVTEESFNRFELLKQEQEKSGKQELEMADLHRKLDSFVIKCDNLEEQNKSLQNDLNTLRQGSAGSNAEIVKLTEELTSKQKLLQQLTDKSNDERLALESQLQELKQSIQSQQSEMEGLRTELKAVEDAKKEQMAEFEIAKKELEAKAQAEVNDLKAAESAKQQTIIESFEAQLKNSEQSKTSLDEAISSLQKQIQLLQDELLKSQLDFKTKEAEMQKQIEAYRMEKEQLYTNLQKTQNEGSSALTNVQQENSRLLQNIEKLTQELKDKEDSFVRVHSEAEQLRIMQSNTKSELELQLQKLQNALDLTNEDCEHKTKLIEEDKKKIDDLKAMLEALKLSNEQISATNAELAEALDILEQEKCETANIFELFEMESDQNMEKLIEKLSSLKEELTNTQEQLRTKESQFEEKQKQINSTDSVLQNTQTALNDAQKTIIELKTQLGQLQQANEELRGQHQESEEKLKQQEDVELQLAEYKKIVDEMDETSSEKSTQLEKLQTHIAQLQQEKSKLIENEKTLKIECTSIQRKLELMEMEKTKEIVGLKQRINDLQSISKLKQNGAAGDNTGSETLTADDSTAQINFLNSIIADMQKKNDTLKAKIEALEALPIDFTKPAAFELIAKRKPAPRVFCDICDEFDKHETEDCPLQASDDRDYSPPPTSEKNNNERKERKLPEPRKYCESCEVFGHEAGECDDECY